MHEGTLSPRTSEKIISESCRPELLSYSEAVQTEREREKKCDYRMLNSP